MDPSSISETQTSTSSQHESAPTRSEEEQTDTATNKFGCHYILDKGEEHIFKSETINSNLLAEKISLQITQEPSTMLTSQNHTLERRKPLTNKSRSVESKNSSASPPAIEQPSLTMKACLSSRMPTKELHFVRSIRCLYEEKAARFEDLDDNTILSILHRENSVSIQEACLGHRAVMSSETFIKALHHHFKEEESKVRRFDCILILKEWFKYKSFFATEFENITLKNAIILFIHSAEKEFGKGAFQKILSMLNIDHDIDEENATPKVQIYNFSQLLDYFDNDPKAIAKELFCLSVELQSKIQADIFDTKSMSLIRDIIPKINNSLKENIIHNLIKKQGKKEKLDKYEFYINLSKASMKCGDLFTCMALFGAFISPGVHDAFQNENEVRKWDSHIEKLTHFAADSKGINLRNKLLENYNIPIHFTHLFSECAVLGDKFPPIEDSKSKSKLINPRLIVAASHLAEDILQRQKCTSTIKTKTSLYKLLLTRNRKG